MSDLVGDDQPPTPAPTTDRGSLPDTQPEPAWRHLRQDPLPFDLHDPRPTVAEPPEPAATAAPPLTAEPAPDPDPDPDPDPTPIVASLWPPGTDEAEFLRSQRFDSGALAERDAPQPRPAEPPAAEPDLPPIEATPTAAAGCDSATLLAAEHAPREPQPLALEDAHVDDATSAELAEEIARRRATAAAVVIAEPAVRSGALLALLVVGMGAAAAIGVGVVVIALITVLRTAIG